MPQIVYQNRRGGELLEPGEYVVEVASVELKVSPKNGTEYFQIKYREVSSGVSFNDSLWFTEKAEWRVDMFLTASGLAPEAGQSIAFDEAFIKNRMLGARLWVRVGQRPDEKKPDRKYNEIAEFLIEKPLPPRGPKIDPADIPSAEQFPKPSAPTW